jgi:hypothetical protein
MDDDFTVENLRIVEADRTAKSREAQGAAASDKLIGCPLWWFHCVYRLSETKGQFAVGIYLSRLRSVHKCDTFDVPNRELEALGITRWVKYRALQRFAAAEIIGISRKTPKSALTVTILATQ